MVTDEQLDAWGKKIIFRMQNGDTQQRAYYHYLKGLATRTERNMDGIIAVCGKRGMGKSSYAILSATLLRQFGVDFNFNDIYFGEDSLDRAVSTIASAKRRAYVFDEMIDLAYSRNAMTILNRRITQFFTKIRKMNNIVFLCLPRFKTLDPGIRNDVVHFWNEVFWKSYSKNEAERFALVALFMKDNNPTSDDPWGLETSQYTKRRAYTPKEQLKVMKRLKGYVGTLRFPPLPDVFEKAYLESSESYLKDMGEKFMESMKPKKYQVPT